MLRVYQYFLFRIYHFYVNVFKEKDLPIFYTSGVSSVILGMTIILMYSFFEYMGNFPTIDFKYFNSSIILITWLLNYIFFIRDKKFLDKNFKADILGGVLIILLIISLILLLIVVAKLHRGEL